MKSVKQFLRPVLVVAALVCPLILAAIYLVDSPYPLLSLWTLSVLAGAFSYVYFILVLVLSSRIPFLDRLFGHDRVLRFHSYLALAGLALGWSHHAMKEPYVKEEMISLQLGGVGFDFFQYIIVITLIFMVPNILHRINLIERIRVFAMRRLKVNYDILKVIHNFTSLGVIFMSLHVLLIPSTQKSPLRMTAISLISAMAIGCYIYHKFIRPLRLLKKKLIVSDVQRLNDETVAINMSSQKGKIPPFRAGQFGFFRFLSKELGRAEHPFTISSNPQSETLSITVKNLGDFSERIAYLAMGVDVLFDGPYGSFILDKGAKQITFVAGGIGITPFLSILKTHKGEDYRITLVWACRYRADLVYHEYLTELSQRWGEFNYIPILSKESDWEGEKGHINETWIKSMLKNEIEQNNKFYLCGPRGFSETVRKGLRSGGVNRSMIKVENFSL